MNMGGDKNWRISPFMLSILAIWFVANLISQFVFISLHGIPYDGIAMLSSLGWVYYVVIVVELLLWVWFFGYLIFKAFKHISQNNSSDEIGNLTTIAKSSILT
tara:strand:- start:275 stop:583 length:309 start_codon:yes stop_codon:yes gene_type:complete